MSPAGEEAQGHEPVMAEAVVSQMLGDDPAGHGLRRLVDGTVGLGGHAQALLRRDPQAYLLGLDRDAQVLAMARTRLAAYEEHVMLRQASYADLGKEVNTLGWHRVDGVLLDLGVCSWQLDNRDCGFSFQQEGPLDLRFSRERGETAADMIRRMPEKELADAIFQYGEERHSRRIAAALKRHLPQTTLALAELVAAIKPAGKQRAGGKSRIHPATKTFQALRILVNQELDHLAAFLRRIPRYLAAGGRIIIIAYHSLEDRMVKRQFQAFARDGLGRVATRQPMLPDESEVRRNRRSRSAKMRVFVGA